MKHSTLFLEIGVVIEFGTGLISKNSVLKGFWTRLHHILQNRY